MGSQTLEILRQGVWASLTGGWFYDPHQGVFCNVVHLYLWLFLLCSPFVTYLYFPATLVTWSIYCVLTSLTILGVKVANMALHRLYDRAQTMSESNLKNPFYKITKDSEGRIDDVGIEMQVLGNDVPSRNSVEQAINEASEENSIMSMENINSIIDLKVDVHRKNSSESIELMFYAPSMMSSSSQQDQQSITGSASVTKSIRSSAAANNSAHGTSDMNTKYLTVYPEHENEMPNTSAISSNSTSSRPSHLVRKSADDFKRRHQRRRLERQSSLDAAAESALVSKLARNQSDTLSTVFASYCNETFLHPQQPQSSHAFGKSTSKANTTGGTTQATMTIAVTTSANNSYSQRHPTITSTTTTAPAASATNSPNPIASHHAVNPTKSSRLQRHRSSETHDERLRHQRRGLFLPIHHEQHHVSSGAGSSGALAAIGGGILDTDELELGLGGSAGVGPDRIEGRRGHCLQSWVLGSSSDMYLEDDSFTKSDLGIEQLDKRNTAASTGSKSRSAIVLQQQHANSHYPHQGPFRQHHHGATIRKDSSSTMSTLQLPVVASMPGTKHGSNMKRRRHSNATTLYKNRAVGGNTAPTLGGGQQPTVRRIKSTALEISCPHPSISNLTPHPNSVEAINGQQQIKNPQSALLPPPSKCLVRNPHLNLCPKFGGSFGSSTCSGSSLNFGAIGSGSSTALIEPVYPIVEQADEKASLDLDLSGRCERLQDSSGELEITDVDNEDDDQYEEAKEDNDEDDEDDVDNDNDDEEENEDENDDKSHNRTHSHLSCQDHSACEPDVCQILAEDEFKDFDVNFEDILNELELEIEGAAALPCAQESACSESDSDDSDEEGQQQRADQQSVTQTLRERLHSTDSETDNNGSRSPLLSGKGRSNSSIVAADKAMMMEIAAVQHQKPLPQHLYDARLHHPKGEGDSGCPSSDCEQVSASSKDMLLSSMDNKNKSTSPTALKLSTMGKKDDTNAEENRHKTAEDDGQKVEVMGGVATTSAAASAAGKSLGAIPKVVKYREVDETRNGKESLQVQNAGHSSQQQLHKRRGGNGSSNGNGNGNGGGNGNGTTNNSTSKAASRTSSSTSSRSFSADSFSADIHKMLWLMSGGAVDENGRPVTCSADDGQTITAQGQVVPSSMSIAHFQFYQDALNALHSHPSNSVDGLSITDRMYLREKIRRSSKQISEPGNSSIGEFSHAHDLPAALLNGTSQGRSSISGQAIETVVSSSSLGAAAGGNSSGGGAGGGGRNSNVAPVTIQGLINVFNDVRHGSVQGRLGSAGAAGNGGVTTSAATILNVDGHQIENYCDYWRPACMLSAEKPSAPKSFYKYRFKLFGYERELKISMDRLELLALFDRDLHWLHILLSVLLSVLVSYLGATILQLGFYKDLFAFLFCAVIAGSQYSLVKSVQPDAASPIHGFNKTVAYSRAIYFSFCGGLLLLFQQMKLDYEAESVVQKLVFFGIEYSPLDLTNTLLHIMYVLLLCFPLIFSLGLFPQINTFLMYFLEQVDMHVFGGNAAGSLLGSFLCVLRSILGILLLYGPLYAALAEGKGTQYIVFSIFCAMLIPLGYHLSRSASDFSHLWALIKTSIVSTYRDDDDELSAATSSGAGSQKLATSTPKRAKSDGTATSPAAVTSPTTGEHIEMASLEKLPTTEAEEQAKRSSLASSSQTLAKTTSSNKKPSRTSASYVSGGEDQCAGGVGFGSENDPARQIGGAGAAVAAAAEDANDEDDSDDLKPIAHSRTTEKTMPNDDDKVSTSSTTNPGDISTLTAGGGATCNGAENDNESPDPLPKKLQNTVNTRLKNDLVVTTLLAVVIFGLHCSTVFTVLQPDLNIVLYAFTGSLGLVLHCIIPQMRKHMPWLCFARPLLRQKEFGQFEVANAAKVMWFEKVYIYLSMVERNVLFPLLVISASTADAQIIADKFGVPWGTLIVAICALKFIRNAYSDPTNQYLIVMFTVLFFRVDFPVATETFLIDYFFISLAFRKCCDFLLKLQFIVTYIAPWQITWGSAFHAFAQPFSVPHSAMLFLQAGVSALLSTPLNPFLGSAIFLTSYVRPIKFWERDYNTRRIDHSNTRLSSQLERDLGADDNNLNSIFYEHLTRSLQHSLCGDLLMGRWGNVNQGDCFVLASDYLNCLVHIIELGNGLCTFQMRGLEFRGTYCQQREVEAITEDVEDNDGCCCCDPGHLPRMLSANAMFSTRWLAWQVVAAQYVLEGYSISDNLASATLQVFEYRKVLITYYIKSIIYYVLKNPKLEKWLSSGPIQDALQHTLSRQFVDLDPIFNYNLDEDFDFRAMGITRTSFCFVYLGWIQYCCDRRKENQSQTSIAPNTPANESRSNLTNLTTSQGQSQSQTQLRSRPQKSATMSGTGTAATNAGSTIHSTEHIATSHSFANISRQTTSESAPGLAGAGISTGMMMGNVSIATQIPNHDGLDNHSTTVGYIRSTPRAPQKPPKTSDRYFTKHESPTTENVATTTANATGREKTTNSQRTATSSSANTIAKDSPIVSLCLALGLLARRSLATASHSSLTGVEFFLHGLHALFKGDFRITSPRDEWVFADMELLHSVVAPAVKMALKLQQDHISNPDEFQDPEALFTAIATYSKDLVISHEADPVWRSAVLRGAPNLLALRHVMEDGSDEYRIIRLTKRFLSFRVIKLNRECVRGLWAGQQQELIYLRNRNPERGSIQNAKQALRNIINSSCDQPIGYPIYVSPLTTSYADTNEQLCQVIGGAITLETIKSNVIDWWHRVRERCRQGCSSGSALETSNLGGVIVAGGGVGGGGCGNVGGESGEVAPVYISAPLYNTLTVGNFFGLRSGNVAGISGSLSGQYGSQSLSGVTNARTGLPALNKPTSTTLLAGLLNRERDQERDRERESMRDPRILRKGQSQADRGDRERRATLPITSTGLGVASGASSSHVDAGAEATETENQGAAAIHAESSPRYTKISCSSGNLGIGNIITTPGEYPRKTNGPICLTTAAAACEKAGVGSDGNSNESVRKAPIELFKEVIIVDGTEIYDCLDLGRRIDVVWPSEKMRANGGRLSWKDWSPRVGMVGHVVHYWLPNHASQRFRSHVNRTLYLIEIGDHYVPVGEFGVREYHRIVDSRENLPSSSSRSLVQREFDERERERERDCLTPILGSSVESPTMATSGDFCESFLKATKTSEGNSEATAKILAVSSSSSSEDEELSNLERRMEMHRRDIIHMMKLMTEKKNDAKTESQVDKAAIEPETATRDENEIGIGLGMETENDVGNEVEGKKNMNNEMISGQEVAAKEQIIDGDKDVAKRDDEEGEEEEQEQVCSPVEESIDTKADEQETNSTDV